MINQDRLVVVDLGMSFRILPPQDGQAPVLARPRGGYGILVFLPPKVRHTRPFDPYACDLWSSMVTLFYLVTGEILYEDSVHDNLKFGCFVMAQDGVGLPQYTTRPDNRFMYSSSLPALVIPFNA
jgi:hypothetical protein